MQNHLTALLLGTGLLSGLLLACGDTGGGVTVVVMASLAAWVARSGTASGEC